MMINIVLPIQSIVWFSLELDESVGYTTYFVWAYFYVAQNLRIRSFF